MFLAMETFIQKRGGRVHNAVWVLFQVDGQIVYEWLLVPIIEIVFMLE